MGFPPIYKLAFEVGLAREQAWIPRLSMGLTHAGSRIPVAPIRTPRMIVEHRVYQTRGCYLLLAVPV